MNSETITDIGNNELRKDNELSRMPNFSEHMVETSADEAIDTHDKKQRIKESFAVLDEMFEVLNADKFGLVGVVEDIKPASEFSIFVQKTNDQEETGQIKEIMNNLGLAYIEKKDDCEYDPDLLESTFYVSKSEETVKEVEEQFNRRIYDDTGEADKRLGQLFGFPETATEWFVEQTKAKKDIQNIPGYSFYIHSPEHAKEEYAQYEAKIMPLFEKYCPISANEMKNS